MSISSIELYSSKKSEEYSSVFIYSAAADSCIIPFVLVEQKKKQLDSFCLLTFRTMIRLPYSHCVHYSIVFIPIV